jgi:hypothetical protein
MSGTVQRRCRGWCSALFLLVAHLKTKKPADISAGYVSFLVPKAGLENLEKSLLVTCCFYIKFAFDPILLHTQVCKPLAPF